ncbi:MAG TPA: DUF4350 domain-containing protein [Terriglobales bacterium]|nr:DUF4350 domain-containing protein [Terriglobales bacterium]
MRILLRVGLALVLLLAAGIGFAWWYDHVGQHSDADFDTRVQSPAYPAGAGTRHPRVLMDEGHRNFHTASGRYKPFAEVLRRDGYGVSSTQRAFTAEMLKDADVLVIANAMGPEDHEGRPAFTPQEEAAVAAWVSAGGSLFLIADHAPFGGAAARLAQRFGVTMHWRYARDDRFHEGWDNERLVFSRDNGLLDDDPITNGRSPSERVNRVVTFTGQSLSGPADAIPLLRLSDGAYDWESRKVRYPAKGHTQALALEFGKGRGVVAGEAAMFSAQVDPLGIKFGMNRGDNDDRQFLLNILHWLSRAQ